MLQTKKILLFWKISNTIILYIKDNPSSFANYKPTALANTIYKLFTSTLTTILANYGEKYQVLHSSQERFRQERCTSRQLQTIIATLEDARLTHQNLYIFYIDFTNTFGLLDHARLLAIMQDLGYPKDVVQLVGNIYSQSHTIYTSQNFHNTKPIPIHRGTIQGDILSPYFFIIFIEPLLRWLDRGNYGYKFKTSNNTINSIAYANNLAAFFSKVNFIAPQINKIDKYCEWTGMTLGISKCAITRCTNKTKLKPLDFTNHLRNANICFRNQPSLILNQNKPYKYLGIHLVPFLNLKKQIQLTTEKLKEQRKQLKNSPTTMKQKMLITDLVIRASIAYAFYAVPFLYNTIKKIRQAHYKTI